MENDARNADLRNARNAAAILFFEILLAGFILGFLTGWLAKGVQY